MRKNIPSTNLNLASHVHEHCSGAVFIFFAEQYGYNIPHVHRVADFYDWVIRDEKQSEAMLRRVRRADPKGMPEDIRRLLTDSYMCFYQNKHLLSYDSD